MKFPYNSITHSLILTLGFNSYAIAQEGVSTQADASTSIDMGVLEVIGQQNSYLSPTEATSSKVGMDPLDTPLTVNSLNQQFLEDIRAETLDDAYGYMTGLSRTGTDADDFTLRGMAGDLNSIQVNGMPGLVSRFGSPTTANVERVEVLKGPASIMYGQIQPGGMINIVTKKPQETAAVVYDVSSRSYLTGVSSFAEDNGVTGTLDMTGPINESKSWLFRLIISAENADSYRDGISEENYYLFPTVTYLPSDSSELTFGLEIQSEKRAADNGLAALNNDINQIANVNTVYQSDGDTDEDKGMAVFATYSTALSGDFDLTVDYRSVWHEDERHLYESRKVDDVNLEVDLRDRDQLNKREYHFVDVRTTGFAYTGEIEHQLLLGSNVGIERKDFLRETYRTYSVDFYNPTDITAHDESAYTKNHRVTDYTNYGVYLQDTMYLDESWVLMGGVRYTRQDVELEYVSNRSKDDSQSTDALVSQAGIVYKLSRNTSLYTSYGESFNPNSVEDKDADGNPFDPEEGTQYEVGTKTNFWQDRANLTVALFDIEKTNIVDENPDTGDNELLGTVTSQGVEAELIVKPVENWQIKLGYAYVDAEISENPDADIQGNRNPFAAYHDAYVWTRYNLPYDFMGGIVGTTFGANYESARYTDDDVNERVELPSYVTVDVGIHYETDDYRTSLNIGNLFDETYYVGGSGATRLYAGEPRNVTLSFTGKF